MKKALLPDWAKKYDAKNLHFREKGKDKFAVLRVTSKREAGKSYPVLVQKHLGIITKEDGFIPAECNVASNDAVLECGLSHFIYTNFFRDLLKSMFNITKDFAEPIIVLATLNFVFGVYPDEVLLKSSYLSYMRVSKLKELLDNSKNKVTKLVTKIGSLFEKEFPDSDTRLTLIALLRLNVTNAYCCDFRGYSDSVLKIFKNSKKDFK